jgi:hypothetical protein
MTEAYVAHRIIRKLAHWGVWAFFTRFQVINGENMPDGGPVIMCVFLDNLPSRRPPTHPMFKVPRHIII